MTQSDCKRKLTHLEFSKQVGVPVIKVFGLVWHTPYFSVETSEALFACWPVEVCNWSVFTNLIWEIFPYTTFRMQLVEKPTYLALTHTCCKFSQMQQVLPHSHKLYCLCWFREGLTQCVVLASNRFQKYRFLRQPYFALYRAKLQHVHVDDRFVIATWYHCWWVAKFHRSLLLAHIYKPLTGRFCLW